MSSIYDDDVNLQADNLNNPRFRLPDISTWLHILMKPVQWLHDNFFTQYLNGTAYTNWNIGTAYIIGDRVQYGIASYECYVANTGHLPTDGNYWYLVCLDNIGVEERKKYNAQKLMLEYVLNRRFSPLTATPPFGPLGSSIYITNNLSIPLILWSSSQDSDSGYTAPRSSTHFYYCPLGNINLTTLTKNFTIFIPTATLAAINANATIAKNTITAEVNKYNTIGITFDIQTY